jgi:hypothetical protein
VILTVIAHKRNGGIGLENICRRVFKVLASALVMALVLASTKGFFAENAGIVVIMAQMAIGAAVYFAAVAALRARD